MPVNTATPLLIAVCIVAAFQASAEQGCNQAPSAEAQEPSSFTKEQAIVEDVLSTVQGRYRSLAYIVTWHGSRVLVSDPLAESNKSVGDSIDFIASRHEVSGDRILAFISTDPRPRRTADVARSSTLEDSSTSTTTGVVEEVLSAKDNGFRFVAYVVRSHDQQVPVADPLALSHHAIGEQMEYLTLRTASPREHLLNFQVQLSAAEKASITRPLCGGQPSHETGVVDQALVTDVDGYKYRAYVVEWRGSKVVIDDPTAATDYQPGDSVSFWVSRFDLLPPGSHKHQWFTFDRPVETTGANQPSDLQTTIAMDSAPVQAVFTSDVDGYRSVAYLVKWHNSPVAIIDAFATTHFAEGDRITFSVARAAAPNTKDLSFMLFELPTRQCAKPQSSSDNSTAAATGKARANACRS
jgi:hypothetical protein